MAERYGSEYLPRSHGPTASKVKNAQEAHEAIRPAGDEFQDLEVVAGVFGAKARRGRLYDLIWKRTVASQMKDAKGESLQVRLGAVTADGRDAVFSASGKPSRSPASFVPTSRAATIQTPLSTTRSGRSRRWPRATTLDLQEITAKGRETKPPARFTEASLVKRLEELGIGRPSTYASIISTIQDRGYVFKKGTALVPTFTAFAAITLLEQHFDDLVDYSLHGADGRRSRPDRHR